jgi:50S ribosomal subunit-associated GTPase HflX
MSQKNTVDEILQQLGPEDKLKNMITIYNKCDLLKNQDRNLISSSNKSANVFYISCKNNQGIDELKSHIEESVYASLKFIKLDLKLRQGSDELAYIYKNAIVREIRECETSSEYVVVKILINKTNALKFVKRYPGVIMVRS